MLVIPMSRLRNRLDAELAALGDLYIFLFTANVDPDLDTLIAALTAGRPAWCDPFILTGITAADADPPLAFVRWDDATFLNDSGGSSNVYGYCVTNLAVSLIHWSERNPAAPVAVADGQSYTVRPYYSRKNQT